jgi:hypothetical protein
MHPDVAGQVRKLLGDDLDLLLCLRNPVDRAVSAFLHHISNGDLDPERNLLEVGQYIGTIDMGFYSLHLENWLRHFSRRQIFCVLLDDILDGPVQVVKSVLNFLGLEDLDDQHESYGDIVFPGLPRIYADDGVYIDVEGEAKLVVSADTLDTLKEMYRPDVVRLETLIDRPLLERWQL